jgi:hypothetical protein
MVNKKAVCFGHGILRILVNPGNFSVAIKGAAAIARGSKHEIFYFKRYTLKGKYPDVRPVVINLYKDWTEVNSIGIAALISTSSGFVIMTFRGKMASRSRLDKYIFLLYDYMILKYFFIFNINCNKITECIVKVRFHTMLSGFLSLS